MRGPPLPTPPLPHSPHAGKPWQHTGAPAATEIIPKPRLLSSISLLTPQIYLAGVGGGVAATREVMSPESGPLPWRALGEAWPCRALAM